MMIDAKLCPQNIKESLQLYVHKRCPPSSFLYMVLSNNLCRSIGLADGTNLAALPSIVAYVWNEIPGDCWGSRKKVEAWLEGGEPPRPKTSASSARVHFPGECPRNPPKCRQPTAEEFAARKRCVHGTNPAKQCRTCFP